MTGMTRSVTNRRTDSRTRISSSLKRPSISMKSTPSNFCMRPPDQSQHKARARFGAEENSRGGGTAKRAQGRARSALERTRRMEDREGFEKAAKRLGGAVLTGLLGLGIDR